jgi:hypothetical protein
MAKLQPWYKVITPREDLREQRPLDAAEFAVHLDKVRLGQAPPDYSNPTRFFERTYLTHTLTDLSAQVVRRLSGEVTETSAIYNMATQFGGGKTHALTLLYHLAKGGSKANNWRDVSKILSEAGIHSIPDKCAVAVFVGTEFDSLKGRGGNDGTPLRKTPWGEIAFQLGGKEAFSVVAQHDEQFIEPKGDVIEAFLPKDRPILILMDEVINYVSTYRDLGYHNKMYNFLQSLSETVRGRNNTVMVVSIPASELSYTDRDEQDQQRFKNMLDRLGKAVLMSVGSETTEIIRRRLFEWDPKMIGQGGKLLLPKEAIASCKEYANWLLEHRQQIPQWFPVDQAQSVFEATYPFHPSVLSVFERKWQELPRFQQTRGILRLLALWVSDSYQKGFKEVQKDPVIGLGSAPLDNPLFRTALLEQIGEPRMEGVITTDVCGKKDSLATRLDTEAVDTIRKSHLHCKVATAVFFESNGGPHKNEASVPEIRLAVGNPQMDIGNIETVLETLYDTCYYLEAKGNQYRFTLKENLNKRFADRSANVKDAAIDEIIAEEIQKVFPAAEGIERVFSPEKSAQIEDRPVITLVIIGPSHPLLGSRGINQFIDSMTKEHGQSARTYKSAVIWAVPESSAQIRQEARKLIAWQDIGDEGLQLDDVQRRQLNTNVEKAKRDLKESVWRAYTKVILLDKSGVIKDEELGMPTSSSADSLTQYILSVLKNLDYVEKESPSPRLLIKNWPPVFKEWDTKSVRDAFFASPLFPRLLKSNAIKDTIARGVSEGLIAYVGKTNDGTYSPFIYKKPLNAADVLISDDVFIIKAEEAEKHIQPPLLKQIILKPSGTRIKPQTKQTFLVSGLDQFGREIETEKVKWSATGGEITDNGVYTAGNDEGNFIIMAKGGTISGTAEISVVRQPEISPEEKRPYGQPQTLTWSGEVAPQKWMNLYTKVLTKFVQSGNLKLKVSIEVTPPDGITNQQVQETKAALKELGMDDDVQTR